MTLVLVSKTCYARSATLKDYLPCSELFLASGSPTPSHIHHALRHVGCKYSCSMLACPAVISPHPRLNGYLMYNWVSERHSNATIRYEEEFAVFIIPFRFGIMCWNTCKYLCKSLEERDFCCYRHPRGQRADEQKLSPQ